MAMKEIIGTLTAKGQITVPVEVQRRLGLRPRDKVAFAIDTETDEVRLRPAAYSLEAVLGSVAPATATEVLVSMGQEAWEEKAREEGRKLRR